MNDKQKEKRALKGYKIKDSVYRKAMRRAKKNKTNLASKIELWVALYADGCDLIAHVPNIK